MDHGRAALHDDGGAGLPAFEHRHAVDGAGGSACCRARMTWSVDFCCRTFYRRADAQNQGRNQFVLVGDLTLGGRRMRGVYVGGAARPREGNARIRLCDIGSWVSSGPNGYEIYRVSACGRTVTYACNTVSESCIKESDDR